MMTGKKPISESLGEIHDAVGAGEGDTALHTHLTTIEGKISDTNTVLGYILTKLEEMRVILAGM